MTGHFVGKPLPMPIAAVLEQVVSVLRLHGFVPFGPLDLHTELRDRVGAQLPPHVVLFVFSPAATHQVLRRDPAAAARTIVPVVIRDTAEGVVVELLPAEPADEPTVDAAIRDMRRRLTHELDRPPVTPTPVARRARADDHAPW